MPDDSTIKTLAARVNGAGSILTAADMGLVPLTALTIENLIWTLRDVADRLEALEAERKEVA